ncbi:hypothetical protein BU23DRAFT_578645 [Bimuria novae-zelandiae CBS 107.79]|uniref:Uncharacterized protein n=1 Tax=Bimuria novae-zelandiae CBS 107.79 TaxID=1447943 RepID=A0A6A5VMN8_9PLEO|nr:hypothetical protein BU23DRAFT_578645 [Bimuria novae-zelandiae CBS 107.79]
MRMPTGLQTATAFPHLERTLLIQDFLIIICGLLYALCYFFYMIRTYADRYCAGTPLYLCTTMAYDLYYAVVERWGFLVRFMIDVAFFGTAMCSAYPRRIWGKMVGSLILGVALGIGLLKWLGQVWPDEREQVTAYWMGIVLQVLISSGSLILLLQRGDTKDEGSESGDLITRYLGCYTAYGVFSWFIILFTLFAETVYRFVYIWAHAKEHARKKETMNGKVKNS